MVLDVVVADGRPADGSCGIHARVGVGQGAGTREEI